MTAGPLAIVVLIAAAACPAMMWWRARRGHEPSCCAPAKPATLDELRDRRAELDARIRQNDAHSPDAA